MERTSEPVRVDKWLWAARFVKTRALAVEAVTGGRVRVNGQRVKPSKEIQAGDAVEITVGEVRRSVVVQGASRHRGPASVAALLYEETPESIEAREQAAAERRLARPAGSGGEGGARPTKRDRRRFEEGPGARRGRR